VNAAAFTYQVTKYSPYSTRPNWPNPRIYPCTSCCPQKKTPN